jgi:hypothetical protein
MPRQQLDYASGTETRVSRGSPRFWAALFISSGICALVSGVMSAVGDHLSVSDLEIYARGLCYLATLATAMSACVYLALSRTDRRVFGIRTLAWLAVFVAGGFVLLLGLVILLLALAPSDF